MINMKSIQTKKGIVNIQAEAKVSKPQTAEQATGDILTTIRQFEPEEQNAIVSHLLKELVTDRFNSVKSTNGARDRAAKNAELFMMATRDVDVAIKEKEYR